MDMYAYVYIKRSKKYIYTIGNKIEDFYYETPGRQSKTFSSKPFKYFKNEKDNAFETCQILIVAATLEDLQTLVAKKRPQVPKLNDSDVPLQNKPCNDDAAAEKEAVQKKRANSRKYLKKSTAITNDRIIQAHSEISQRSNDEMTDFENENIDMNEDKDEDNSDECEDKDNYELERDERSIKEKDDDEELSPPPRQLATNNNLLEEVHQLKNLVTKLRTDKLKVLKVTKKLQAKCNSLQNVIGNLKTKGSNQKQKRLKPKGFPLPICTDSNIMVRADVLEDADTKLKPSIFYEHLCYAAWSKKDLATRCVKKTRKTPDDLIKMTPRKRRAIKEHFIHYLKYYKYHTVLFAKEMSNINCYAHRAITAAKKHRKTVDQYPELSSDEEIDVDKIEL